MLKLIYIAKRKPGYSFDGATGEYDAVACFMICEELFSAMTEDDAAGAAKMAADELETFASIAWTKTQIDLAELATTA